MRAMEISRSGLEVEWRRMEVIASNLANMNTVRTATGEPFRPQRLISGPRAGFADAMDSSQSGSTLAGVRVYGVEALAAPSRRVYEPSHPQADADGYVTYPGVDHAAEMTLMIRSSRAYEANLVAMNMARQMYTKALELGQQR